MTVVDYDASPRQSHWLGQIALCEWAAGCFLHQLLTEGRFHALLGARSRLLLLTEGDALISFCTYAQRDEIPADDLTPWVGFAYTFPQHRGRRRLGKLLEHAYRLAKAEGHPCIYLSTDHIGLYEKYGFSFWRRMQNRQGKACRVYRLEIRPVDFSALIGRRVSGTIDRPVGSAHPRHPSLIYPLNYGCVDGVQAGDGEPQDVYVLGADRPLESFTGTVIAVWHRLNDCEDKWIVALDGQPRSDEALLAAIDFQEQFFMGELCR